MANNFKDNHSYDIVEILGIVSPQADLNTDWKLAVVKALMKDTRKDGDEGESSIDIRDVNIENKRPGKGVRLSIQGANNVVDILLENGYGSMEVIEKEYNRRKSLFE